MDNNKPKTTIEVEDGTVVILLTPYAEDGFKAAMHHITSKKISEDDDQLFLNVLARGMVSVAFNDMDYIIEEGQAVIANQIEDFSSLDDVMNDVVKDIWTEDNEDRFKDPNVIDLASMRPKGRA